MHLKDCPSGSIDEPSTVKVVISPKSDMNELEMGNNNSLKVEEDPNIKEEAEANVPATKSTHTVGY